MLHFPLWKKLLTLATCLLFMWWALPNVLSSELRSKLPAWAQGDTVNLGLDLRGGSHLLLEVDTATYNREKLETLRSDVRARLLKQKVGYTNIAINGNQVTVEIREETLKGRSLQEILSGVAEGAEVSISGTRATVVYTEQEMRRKMQQLIEQSIEIVSRRVNESGTKEPIIQRQGENQIVLQVPGLQDPAQLKRILGKTAKMTFHLVNVEVTADQMAQGGVPFGTKILEGDVATVGPDVAPVRYPVYSKVELSGEMLTNASATFDQGQPVVSFSFNSEGARRFGEITSKNVDKPFAIVLDDKVITAPRIRGPILGGSGIISGSFTVQSANDLALLLRAGALPAPLKIVEERSVGPSLGNDSIQAGKKASIVAVIAVMGFMLLFYGLFGVFANIALLFNMIMILGALSLFQATLTLPGIAGIVLTLGMAVDANVLIYERIREELARGRSSLSAIETGFKMAFGTIFDSNITTLAAAFLLYYFGSGTIKGFAVTLVIGILASMFTAILLTRMMISAWYKAVRPKTIPL